MDELFEQPVKNDLRTYKNIRKIANGQGNDYTTGFFPRLYLIEKIL